MSIRRLVLVRRDTEGAHPARWSSIVVDAILAIGVLGAVNDSSTPLVWLALLFPVIEAAVLFTLVQAAVVWMGVSVAFLALRLTVQADAETNTIGVALQRSTGT